MIRIVADSSSLYSKNEGKEKGISIAPLAVNINGQTYKEFEDINTYEFIEIIKKHGHAGYIYNINKGYRFYYVYYIGYLFRKNGGNGIHANASSI